MELMYATLLLHSVGKEINEENLKKVLEAAGAQADEGKIKAVVAALEGKNIDEILEKAAMPVAAPAAAPAEEKKEEEKKEEEEEKKAEEAAAGLAALFG
jgi:large subunit ribosomal protein L12